MAKRMTSAPRRANADIRVKTMLEEERFFIP
jgi:hypothetical protein